MNTSTTSNTSNTSNSIVYRKIYDNRFYNGRCSRTYAEWTEGAAYVVVTSCGKYVTAWYKHTTEKIPSFMDEVTLRSMEIDSYESWETIPFNQINLLCQKDLVNQMGDKFPWELCSWESPAEFAEYWDPQTIEGIIEKSLTDSQYFLREVKNGPKHELFFGAISDTLTVECSTDGFPYLEELIKIGDNVYRYRTGFGPRAGSFAHLDLSSNNTFEEEKEKQKKRREQEALARKEHARKCGLMARKYGIPFEISLRCFKGNEELIKAFVESLKQAFGKEYDSWELSCGRNRRRAEISRLGIVIGFVDPNYIADYILTCLDAGKIVKA